jgi:peptidoglycan/xylan/chitin deacetylase (PgdA/CDA1 family)
MFIYDMARKINAYRKIRRKAAAGRFLSPVRRIERTAPLSSGRFVAMTFDDGPSAAFPNPPVRDNAEQVGLTEELLNILNRYGAKGTFDVIGTTEHNYPDKAGAKGDFTWSGVSYDHYPEFGQDKLAGVENQLQLAREIAAGGHELASHGYSHILFGPMRLVYGKRVCFKSLREVVEDLEMLDRLVLEKIDYKIRLSRPPHYIDRIPDGHTSYDAYRYMNYQYLAASFDAGGWKPTKGSYEQDVREMTDLIERALQEDPGALNGQIIFQKDGCNMSLQTPVASALDKCLKLLTDAGYKVVTASELINMSPFEDIDDSDPCFEPVRKLTSAGFVTGYKNNTFQPDRLLTGRELAVMTASPELLLKRYREQVDVKYRPGVSGVSGVSGAAGASGMQVETVYQAALGYARENSRLSKAIECLDSDEAVTERQFDALLNAAADGTDISWNPEELKNVGIQSPKPGLLRRRDVVKPLAELLLNNTNG